MNLETLMRLTPPAIALAAALATVSSVGHSARPNVQVNERSAQFVKIAQTNIAAGRLDAANDALETSLAIDPRNRTAFLALADVARRQGLPGKAVRFYREALLIEPNDVVAITAQGEALVQKGALVKARENLARAKTLCVGTCPELSTLSDAIERGSVTGAVMSAQAVQTKPVATSTAPN